MLGTEKLEEGKLPSIQGNKNSEKSPSQPTNSKSGGNSNPYPSQNTFTFDNGVIIDSCFDSGNLADAKETGKYRYDLWISPDAINYTREACYRSWFYFRVRNIEFGERATFTIKNMNFQAKLYNEGLRPYYRLQSNKKWERLNDPSFSWLSTEKFFEITFHYSSSVTDDEAIYFAFVVPWSYEEDQALVNQLEQDYQNDTNIYFNRENLIWSIEKRRLDLLTISSKEGMLSERESPIANLFPGGNKESRPFKFDPAKKKYVLISARVHPGEVAASHVMRRLLTFLLDRSDPRAKAARDQYVFCIIPMLNPDGVYRGHYRADSLGQNLNRYYINPSLVNQPTIYGAKQLIMNLNNSGRLFLYLDLHAHAGKKGCFVYGNTLDYSRQIQSRIFPKLLSLNSTIFDYEGSSFSDANLKVKEKGQIQNKDGAGRVAIYKATNLVNCYTLEVNYNAGKIRNILTQPVNLHGPLEEEKGYTAEDLKWEEADIERYDCSDPYKIQELEQLGEAIVVSLADMAGANPLSRLASSPYKKLRNIKVNIALKLLREAPFKYDTALANLSKNLGKNMDALMAIVENTVKREPREPPREPRQKTREPRQQTRESSNSVNRSLVIPPKKTLPAINKNAASPNQNQKIEINKKLRQASPAEQKRTRTAETKPKRQPLIPMQLPTQQIRLKKDIIIKRNPPGKQKVIAAQY